MSEITTLNELRRELAEALGYTLMYGFSTKFMAIMWYMRYPDGSKVTDPKTGQVWMLCKEADSHFSFERQTFTEDEAWRAAPIPDWSHNVNDALARCFEIKDQLNERDSKHTWSLEVDRTSATFQCWIYGGVVDVIEAEGATPAEALARLALAALQSIG